MSCPNCPFRFLKRHFLFIEVLIGAKDFVGPSDKSTHTVISSVAPYQRRSSVPCETNLVVRSSVNGKRRNPKKVLRRRSSSGAEILTPIMSESGEATTSNATGSAWNRFKKEWTRRTDSDVIVTKQRRGSLPIEVLAIGFGKFLEFYERLKVNSENIS